MKRNDALQLYWSDPAHIVVPAHKPDQTIAWLGQQTADTWHRVAMTWNFDYGTKALAWILAQDDCDKGTAARLFLIEGVGHWLWDVRDNPTLADDRSHLCRIVLENWHRYRTGDLQHGYDIHPTIMAQIMALSETGVLADTPLAEIAHHVGKREAKSRFASEDGKVVLAFDHWAKAKGIDITPR